MVLITSAEIYLFAHGLLGVLSAVYRWRADRRADGQRRTRTHTPVDQLKDSLKIDSPFSRVLREECCV